MSAERHRLGNLIERIERTNADGRYGVEDVRGVSNTKLIQKTKANMEGRDFTPFTILNPKEFVFNRRTTRMASDLVSASIRTSGPTSSQRTTWPFA